MLTHVRLATKDEVESLRDTSNYTQQTVVWAMDQNEGDPDFAVFKIVSELDPVYFGKRTNDVQKARFLYSIEERLMGMGVNQYFFNIPSEDEHYQKIMKNWGAEQVSQSPQLKFQMVLTRPLNANTKENTND